MAIKSILGGKSKNLCDVAYLLTLPIDTQFSNYGFWEVEVDVEPNTTYTLSRENSDLINLGATTYLGLSNEYTNPSSDDAHHRWLNHQVVPDWCRKSVTLTSNADGKLWIFFSSPVYTKWQKNLNPFGYIQIEKGSTATEYVPYELTSYKSIMKVSDVCQLVPISDKADKVVNEVTFTNNHDGGWTISGTPSTYTWYGLFLNMPLKNGHKYLNTGAGGNTYIEIKWRDKDDVIHWEANPYTADENSRCDVTLMRAINATGVKIVFPQLFDLTEMYGAGNEPKTVAEFKAKFPNDYYPYSPSRFVTSYDERMPCKTKNLFSSSVEVGVPSSTKFDKSEKRLLEDGKWYIGLTGSNYYSRDAVLDYSIMENSVYIKWRSNGYSAAKCIYCEPNTTYSFTKKYSLIQGHSLGINVGFYTEDGTFISVKGETASPRFVFTTPENCKYVSICLSGTKVPNNNFGAGYYSDLQLVKGTTVTDYVPYDYV